MGLTSHSSAVQIYYNDDGGSAFIFVVESMKRVLCWPRTHSLYVCMNLNMKVLMVVVVFDAV